MAKRVSLGCVAGSGPAVSARGLPCSGRGAGRGGRLRRGADVFGAPEARDPLGRGTDDFSLARAWLSVNVEAGPYVVASSGNHDDRAHSARNSSLAPDDFAKLFLRYA